MAEDPGSEALGERFRALPSVHRLLAGLSDLPHRVARDVARSALDRARALIRAGGQITEDGVADIARQLADEHSLQLMTPVINATGVMIHTNLGRVPLGESQLEAVRKVAGGYSNLEFDLVGGRRGDRYALARRTIAALTGAESAVVVNNNAAAVLVTLSALCDSREVLVSRGELIEIGGEFRIPDIMGSSGARLVEVGTTNRTHLSDYERAITPASAAILKVHPSNYRVVGFTSAVTTRDLARLGRGRGVLLIYDMGSGSIEDAQEGWTAGEPKVSHAIEDGADIVTFSGDKLLGGPQAGIIAGRKDLIDRIARHPLMRAVRPGKMSLAALEATLKLHLEGRRDELPLWRMASETAERLEERANSLASLLSGRLNDAKVEARLVAAVAGGGTLPDTELASWAIAVRHPEIGAAEIQRALRMRPLPVVGRIEDDVVLLDLRTVAPEEEAVVAEALVEILS